MEGMTGPGPGEEGDMEVEPIGAEVLGKSLAPSIPIVSIDSSRQSALESSSESENKAPLPPSGAVLVLSLLLRKMTGPVL